MARASEKLLNKLGFGSKSSADSDLSGQSNESSAEGKNHPTFTFKFEFVKDDAQTRTMDIPVQAETREYAWRSAVEIASQKAEEGETARFIGDVVPEAAGQ